MTPTVACVGLAVQDLVFGLDGAVDLGNKNFSSSLRIVGGGPAANAAATVSALGGSSRLIARLGSDSIGDSIIANLVRHDVDVSRVRRVPDAVSPISAVIVDGRGERTIVNHSDGRLVDGSGLVSPQDILGSQALLVDLRWPEGALSAIHHANTLGIPSVVDFDLTTTDSHDAIIVLDGIISSATHLIFSKPALLRKTGTTDTAAALLSVANTTDAFVGVTLGAEGFSWLDVGTVRVIPAFEVDAVNTLGAGDVFHGAFALGLAEGRSIVDVIRWSSAAAALHCTRTSPGEGFPTRDRLANIMTGVQP
jgi:sulfofructose kinase